MDAEQPSGSNVPDANRQKRDDEAGPSGISAVETTNPAEIATVKQTGDIFKLDIDCYEETFDFLLLKDLVNVSKTCKRLRDVAGYCFQQNYLGDVHCSSNVNGFDINELGINLIPFVRRLNIHRDCFQSFVSVRSKFRRLKKICCFSLDAAQMNCIKEISVDEVEELRINRCHLGDNVYEFINKCAKLRCLIVEKCVCDYNWIDHKYPTLEYFQLLIYPSYFLPIESIEGIAMFLEINPNIRKFATRADLLLLNRENFISANVKLDNLAIYLNDSMAFQSTIDLLNTLYEHGFYKKLQLYSIRALNQEQVNRLATLNGLNKLGLLDVGHNVLDFSAFRNIEELYLRQSIMGISEAEMLSTALINLKRIQFFIARIDVIVLFIRKSVRMHRIKINNIFSGVHFNEDTKVIDSHALNREREQLPDAEKITLFVEENIYLATKWTVGDTDFSLIRLKRDTSFDWFHDFE